MMAREWSMILRVCGVWVREISRSIRDVICACVAVMVVVAVALMVVMG